MSKFDEFLQEALAEAAKLARGVFQTLEDDLRADAEAFLNSCKDDLRRWTADLAAGRLTPAEFRDLVEGQKALLKMHALTAAGIGLADAQRLRDALIAAIVDAAFKVFI